MVYGKITRVVVGAWAPGTKSPETDVEFEKYKTVQPETARAEIKTTL